MLRHRVARIQVLTSHVASENVLESRVLTVHALRAAPRAKLIVVDGSAHRVRQSADVRRDRKLARLGYRVLRLEADLVLRHMPLALQRIREVLRGPLLEAFAAQSR